MGDTGETPLLFKGFKLMVNYWHRLHKLPNISLANTDIIHGCFKPWICGILGKN